MNIFNFLPTGKYNENITKLKDESLIWWLQFCNNKSLRFFS